MHGMLFNQGGCFEFGPLLARLLWSGKNSGDSKASICLIKTPGKIKKLSNSDRFRLTPTGKNKTTYPFQQMQEKYKVLSEGILSTISCGHSLLSTSKKAQATLRVVPPPIWPQRRCCNKACGISCSRCRAFFQRLALMHMPWMRSFGLKSLLLTPDLRFWDTVGRIMQVSGLGFIRSGNGNRLILREIALTFAMNPK